MAGIRDKERLIKTVRALSTPVNNLSRWSLTKDEMVGLIDAFERLIENLRREITRRQESEREEAARDPNEDPHIRYAAEGEHVLTERLRLALVLAKGQVGQVTSPLKHAKLHPQMPERRARWVELFQKAESAGQVRSAIMEVFASVHMTLGLALVPVWHLINKDWELVKSVAVHVLEADEAAVQVAI